MNRKIQQRNKENNEITKRRKKFETEKQNKKISHKATKKYEAETHSF
jgi:hypothetical protein